MGQDMHNGSVTPSVYVKLYRTDQLHNQHSGGCAVSEDRQIYSRACEWLDQFGTI